MDKTKSKISILSVCLLLMGTMALTPLLADIAASFPGAGPTSIQVLSTLPNLFVIIFNIKQHFIFFHTVTYAHKP